MKNQTLLVLIRILQSPIMRKQLHKHKYDDMDNDDNKRMSFDGDSNDFYHGCCANLVNTKAKIKLTNIMT